MKSESASNSGQGLRGSHTAEQEARKPGENTFETVTIVDAQGCVIPSTAIAPTDQVITHISPHSLDCTLHATDKLNISMETEGFEELVEVTETYLIPTEITYVTN